MLPQYCLGRTNFLLHRVQESHPIKWTRPDVCLVQALRELGIQYTIDVISAT